MQVGSHLTTTCEEKNSTQEVGSLEKVRECRGRKEENEECGERHSGRDDPTPTPSKVKVTGQIICPESKKNLSAIIQLSFSQMFH